MESNPINSVTALSPKSATSSAISQREDDPECWIGPTDLTGSELVDQQGASLGVLPAVEAVQLSGHLVELFISVVELCQELRVRPLHRNTWRSFSTLYQTVGKTFYNYIQNVVSLSFTTQAIKILPHYYFTTDRNNIIQLTLKTSCQSLAMIDESCSNWMLLRKPTNTCQFLALRERHPIPAEPCAQKRRGEHFNWF